MPAKLDLLPRKKFEITMETGEVIKGQFGTWALFRFCKKKGVGLEGLYDTLTSLGIDDVTDFVLCAIEQSCREEGKPFTYTDVDLCKWADEMEGAVTLTKIFSHYGSDEEKKSQEVAAAPPLDGPTSSESQPVAA